MANKNKRLSILKEAGELSTPKEKVRFVLKYSENSNYCDPEHSKQLHKHKDRLEQIFNFYYQIPLHKSSPRSGTQNFNGKMLSPYSKKDYKEKIKTLENFKKRISSWKLPRTSEKIKRIFNEVDSLIIALENSIAPPKPGGKKKGDEYHLFITYIIGFWMEDLGHKKFLYDFNKPHRDQANKVVDLIVMAEFQGRTAKEIRGLQSRFLEFSDKRANKNSENAGVFP